jgi:hypothetical protein
MRLQRSYLRLTKCMFSNGINSGMEFSQIIAELLESKDSSYLVITVYIADLDPCSDNRNRFYRIFGFSITAPSPSNSAQVAR